MKHLAFVTDGAIDLRSFSTFGFNSKPNTTSPIGFFGTGLKISTAVIARLGCKMMVLVDGVQHEFYTKETDFRGKTFDVVRMRKRKSLMARWQYQEMPFTTELGKNWEPWQVFRELESNTRDENGQTFVVDDEDPHGMSFLNDDHKGKTVIIIDEPSIVECYYEMDKIFLPEGLTERAGNDRVQVLNQPSQHLYYRGMRVIDLPLPSALTYNILSEQRLTEDRTLYSHSALWEIRDFVMNCQDMELVEKIVALDEKKFWEGKIEFDDAWSTAGATFLGVVGKRKAEGLRMLPRVSTYYERYHPAPDLDPQVTVTRRRSEWEAIHNRLQYLVTEGPVDDELNKLLEEIAPVLVDGEVMF